MKAMSRDEYHMIMELVPPGCHRQNVVEVAIQNVKARFPSVLTEVAEIFTMEVWDRLLLQTEITHNLLRQSSTAPAVSAYAHRGSPFGYNKIPIAPIRCGAQATKKTNNRGTWTYHSVLRWMVCVHFTRALPHTCVLCSRESSHPDLLQCGESFLVVTIIAHEVTLSQHVLFRSRRSVLGI